MKCKTFFTVSQYHCILQNSKIILIQNLRDSYKSMHSALIQCEDVVSLIQFKKTRVICSCWSRFSAEQDRQETKDQRLGNNLTLVLVQNSD